MHQVNHTEIAHRLSKNAIVFEQLLNGKSSGEYLWRQDPAKWNLLEIVCHLYDEERDDFRARVKHTLYTPSEPLPPIDPPGWVIQRNYAGQQYAEKLDAFLAERKESVGWLLSLSGVDWDNAYDHPKFGKMRAGMFLANWLAHDYLHLRQILALQFDYLKLTTGENLAYAGNW